MQNTFSEFNTTTSTLLEILLSLSEEQLNFQPKEGWSAGQLGDHLLKTYAFVDILNGTTRKTDRSVDQKMKSIKTLFSDNSIKMDAPKAVIPSNKKINKKDLIKGLQNRVEQIEMVIQTQDLSLICCDFSIPEYGEFTRFEWIWFNIYHTQRHIYQLKRLIATFYQ